MSERLDDLEGLKATAEELHAKALRLLIRRSAEPDNRSLQERLDKTASAYNQIDRAIALLEREVA